MSTYTDNIIKTLTYNAKNGKNITRYIGVLNDIQLLNLIETGKHFTDVCETNDTPIKDDVIRKTIKKQYRALNLLLKNVYDQLKLRYGIFAQCDKFTNTMNKKINKTKGVSIDKTLVNNLVKEELAELDEAKSETQEVDAVHDAIYCLAQQLSQAGYTPEVSYKIFDIIHKANMTKFGDGGKMRSDGKWVKPSNFVAPDADIKKTLNKYNNTPERQLKKIKHQQKPSLPPIKNKPKYRILQNPNKKNNSLKLSIPRKL